MARGSVRTSILALGRSSLAANGTNDGTGSGSQCIEQDILSAVKGLRHDLGSVDASQLELKVLMIQLNAKVDAVATSLGSCPAADAPGRSEHQVCRFLSPSDTSAPHSDGDNRSALALVATPLEEGIRNIRHSEVTRGSVRSDVAANRHCSVWSVASRVSLQPRDQDVKSWSVEPLEPLRLRTCLEEYAHAHKGRKLSARQTTARRSTWSWDSKSTEQASGLQAWSPDSRSRKVLDFLGFLIIFYDAFVLPYRLAWQPDEQANLGMWATCIFWTIYLPLQLVTGFRDSEGRLHLDLKRCARRYLKSWFVLDLTVVVCDWLSILISERRHFRYLRIMRLVRGGHMVSKFVALVQAYKLSSQFLEVHLSMDISLLWVFILWVNHVVSCGWYGIGKYAYSDTGLTWTAANFNAENGPEYEYSTSLHWALTQMTPASMEVVPECTLERAYNIFTIIFSMLVFSSFGATLTSSLTQYRLHKEKTKTNFMQLQTYLLQQGVDPDLGMAVKLQVQNHLRKRQRLQWKSVVYLDYTSKTLKEALWHSCCMKCIRQHAFLQALNLHDSNAIVALCHSAIVTVEYSQGDIVFEVGVDAKEGCMHFLICGRAFYEPGPAAAEAGRVRGDPLLTLGEDTFISEIALWTEWKHLGTLFVEAPTEALQLKSEKLVEALQRRFPDTMQIVAHYCLVFHASVHELGCVRSDLPYTIDPQDLMFALESTVRMDLANPVMEKLRTRGGLFNQSNKSLEMLDSELQAGKCNVGFEDNEPVRTVSVVAVKLFRSDSDTRFLVKVGEHMRNGDMKASCVLPGRKRVSKESARDAVERTLETDLAEIKDCIIQLPGNEKTVFLKDSASYGVRTRYLRTTYNAVLSEEATPPIASAAWASCDSQELAQGYHHMSTESGESSMAFFKLGRSVSFVMAAKRCRKCIRRLARGIPGFSSSAESGDTPMPTPARRTGKRRVVNILTQQDSVILLPCDEASKTQQTVNVWLTQEEFDVLSGDIATPIIRDWLACIDCNNIRRRRVSESMFLPSAV